MKKTKKEKKAFKELLSVVFAVVICVAVGFLIGFFINNDLNKNANKLEPLPKPELADGIRGEKFYIDKNINETTIDNYLDREDTVYRMMLMLEDTASWENKGGSRYLTGFLRGFEVVPYPYLSGFSEEYREIKKTENVDGLYDGETLFKLHSDGTYTANYEESMDILEYLFPKDKNIILMCGGGGYAGITKQMLVALGWDENKIYNAGAYWSYEGNNDIKTERKTSDGKTVYDFWKVAYHDIDFSKLTKVKSE